MVGLIVGFGAPIIGAVVDVTGRRLPWIIGFSTLYVIRLNVTVVDPTGRVQYVMDALCVWDRFYRRGICVDFYQRPTAQLPNLGPIKLIGKISRTGFAFGYVSGLLSLVIMLALFLEQPSGKRFWASIQYLEWMQPSTRARVLSAH